MIFRQIQNNNISCKQMQLCNTLRRLWMEHVMWTRSFILSTAFDSGDLDAVTKRLLQNPVDFAKAMNPYYGPKVA
ncbi:MAG TPA: acetylglutamate kinase, partial [Clostridiales bacterium]|nr:acetylglutamate kinase [Clostridiales bacterium]